MNIRVRMLESVDQLAKGDVVNLPARTAQRLIAARKAEALTPAPSATKVAVPKETKAKK